MKAYWIALPAVAVLLLLAMWLIASPAAAPVRKHPMIESVSRPAVDAAPPIAELPLAPPNDELPPSVLPGVAPLDVPVPVNIQAPLSKTELVRTEHPSGFCKEFYSAYTSESADGQGAIVEVARPKSNGPSYLLVGSLSGNVPELKAVLRVEDADGELVCTVKLVRVYYVDDNEELPVEELGCATIDESAKRPCAKTDLVTWSCSREVRHGTYQAWYEDGTRACEGEYVHGCRSSEWSYWHRNGGIRARGSFPLWSPRVGMPPPEQLIGVWNWWYDSGSRHASAELSASAEWRVWTETGEFDPFHDPKFLEELDPFLKELRKGNYDQAKETLDAIVRRRPENAEGAVKDLYEILGRMLAGMQDLNDRTDWFDVFLRRTEDARPELPPPVFAPVAIGSLDVTYTPFKDRDPNEP